MEFVGIGLFAAAVLAWSLVEDRLAATPVTGPMVFVVLGLALGPSGVGLVDLDVDDPTVSLLTELTLVLVLFTDAARIDPRRLRAGYALPVRLLGIGLPLCVAAGTAAGALLLGDLSIAEAAVLAAVLAPTDAALGAAVVEDRRLPVRVRQTLNVESGLNDGIALPAVTVLLGVAGLTGALDGRLGGVRFAAVQVGLGVAVGVLVGCAGGLLVDAAARRGWAGPTSRRIAALAIAVLAFAASSAVGGNGFIAAFVGGLGFGAVAREHCDHVNEFAEAEGRLLTLGVFAIFGGGILGPRLGTLTVATVAYVAASLTVVRMLPVAFALVGSGVHRRTAAFLGWFGPRGLASILFALLVVEEAASGGPADRVLEVTTWAVAASVVAHGVTAAPLAARYAQWLERRRADVDDMPEHRPAAELPTRS